MPPPLDFGKTVNPILTRGRGDYAQHITICSQVFQTFQRPYQVPGLGPSFEKCEKGKGFPLSFQPKFEFYLQNMARQSLASLVHTPPCILPKLTFFRNRSQGSFLFDIVRKLCGLLMIDSSDGFISSIFDKCSMLLQTIWPSNHTSHTKIYFNEFVANALRDNIGSKKISI